MTTLHNENIMCASREMNTPPNNDKRFKTRDSWIRDLGGCTNHERRGVAEANTTYVDPSALGVHNENGT